MRDAPESPRFAVVGLTGGIAAGKSEALAAFSRLGAATLSADAVVHELLASERVRDLLVGRWGEEVAPGGVVDRAAVGARVFGRERELAWLEATLHPLVSERILEWLRSLGPETPLAVVEVPLLFETGMEASFDATVSVTAPDAIRVERAGVRGTSELAGREARQLTDAEKAARAAHVIRNDGSLERLEAQVEELVRELTGVARG